MANVNLVVRPADAMAHASEILRNAIKRAARPNTKIRVAIPGGSALQAWTSASLDEPLRRTLRLTWVDERCVPVSDAASNRGTAERAHALDSLDESLPLYRDGETAIEARNRTEDALRKRFDGSLDIVLLGLGEDGHIASLFPGQFDRNTRDFVVIERASPKPPPERISLSYSFLKSARSTLLVATGESKRAAIERVLASDPALPSTGLPNLTLVTDLENLPRSSS